MSNAGGFAALCAIVLAGLVPVKYLLRSCGVDPDTEFYVAPFVAAVVLSVIFHVCGLFPTGESIRAQEEKELARKKREEEEWELMVQEAEYARLKPHLERFAEEKGL